MVPPCYRSDMILHNERHRGVVTWGKTQKIRSSETGRRIYQKKAESEWRQKEIPDQRIISDDLWNAVRARMAAVNEMYSLELRRPGILRARAVSSPYIFSGLLKCSLCGASVTIVSGCSRKRTDVRYGCSLHYNRGRGACGNKLLIPRRVLESQLLAGLQAKVLHPQVVSYVLKSFEAQLAHAFDRRRDETATHRRRALEIERKIENLTRALADGYSPAIRADLARLEEQLANIRRTSMADEPETLGLRIRDTRDFVGVAAEGSANALLCGSGYNTHGDCKARARNHTDARRWRVHSNGNLGFARAVAAWMVPGARIELATPAFSGRRSTNELPRLATLQF